MFNYVTGLLLSFSVIFIIIVSLDLEFINSSKISFGQISNFSDNNDISSNNNNSSSSSNNNNNSSKIEIATTKEKEKEEATTTEDWLTYSNNKFELKYPPVGWNVEKKLSKFHVLDFKLIKNDPFSFIGISFSSLADSDKFTNEIILDEAENFGMYASSSGYKVYEVLEKKLNNYTIDTNPSSFHIVKYKYKDNDLEGKMMEIFSIIDKRLFTLTYQSTIENFDKDLPVVEKIVDSIKIIN
ncbi:MAG TPA: hypothetical protein VFR65_10435 [Nitrososphaeraceae archaeon]|nr:hypothetical protein [Nitrososphaeraceae archaeon]